MSVTKIHHINFVVKDLTLAVERYQQLLGLGDFIVDALPSRGVITARIALAEQWLVLIQPVDMESVAGCHLKDHGEGFFLISYSVDDLNLAAQNVAENRSQMTSVNPRLGLYDWQVWDVDVSDTFGAQIQFCHQLGKE